MRPKTSDNPNPDTRAQGIYRLPVQHTHEKLRTLTCLARSLSLASRLEHSNQTNNSRRWPSVPCFPWPASNQTRQTRTTGSWSWLRFAVPSRIAHPWRRVSQVRLRGCCAEVPVGYRPNGYPGNYFSSISQTNFACSSGRRLLSIPQRRVPRRSAEPSNDIKHASRGQAPANKFLLPTARSHGADRGSAICDRESELNSRLP